MFPPFTQRWCSWRARGMEVKNHTGSLLKKKKKRKERGQDSSKCSRKAVRKSLLGNWDMSNYVPYPLWQWWESVVSLSPGEICVPLPPQSLAGLRLWLMRLICYIGQVCLSLSSALVIARACTARFRQ